MKEIEDIIIAYQKAVDHKLQTALATVVLVEGSSYRRPGARMLITENGQLTGAISGGCLEGDALRKALMAMQEEKNKLVTYDTTDEDDAKLGVQLGCNGIIHILIEPIQNNDPNNPIELLKQLSNQRQQAVIATLFTLQNRSSHQPGTCILLTNKENKSINLPNHLIKNQLLIDAKEAFLNKSSIIKDYKVEETNFTAFIEFIEPAIAIIIAGAGNDALPLVNIATILGWHVTVIDGRANYLTAQRFVNTTNIVAKPESALQQLKLDNRTFAVLMTHNYNYDLAMLKGLLNTDIAYIGVLGPKKKLQRMLDDVAVEGIKITKEQQHKIYGPVGLDVGAETAEEIALSITAEIKAVAAGKAGKSLRYKQTAIHAHLPVQKSQNKLSIAK